MKEIEKALSNQRLKSYLRPKDGIYDLDVVLSRYKTNLKISESLYPSLHIVEVTFRNHVHFALKNLLGENWLYPGYISSNFKLRDKERETVSKAISKLKKTQKEIKISKVIAELNFGYWTSLFNSYYEPLWRQKALLQKIFPNFPKDKLQRKSISKMLNQIRYLRNRVFHYEPIWHWSDIKDQHQNIISLVKAMNDEAFKLLSRIDNFSKVYKDQEKL